MRGARTIIIFAALAGAVFWAATNRPVPAAMTQEDYHRIATQSEHGVFTGYPLQREVVITPVDKSYLELAVAYVRQAISPMPHVAGLYDDQTRTVSVTSELVCATAGLPDRLQAPFVRTLRHEYGHAFAEDILKIECAVRTDASGETFMAYTEAAYHRDDAEVLPHVTPDLELVVRDWQESPPNIYGNAHLTSTFSEYLAESYARFLSGKPVPDATRRFLQSRSEVGVY
jgi:hypothetical protein